MQTKPWMAQYAKEVRPHDEYPKHNLAKFLLDTAGKYPQHPAIDFYGKEISYAQLLSDSARLSGALRRRGIRKGDRVAVMLPNCPQSVIAFYAVLMAGAIVVQTNPMYRERELEAHFGDSEPAALITLDSLYPRIAGLGSRSRLRLIVLTDVKDYMPMAASELVCPDQVESLVKLIAEQPDAPPEIEDVHAEDDVAILQYTGGTTGTSKGVMLTHYNLIANTLQSSRWSTRIEEGKERYLAVLPFFHVFGMTSLMNQSVYVGGTLLLLPKFSAEEVLETIRRKRPTIFPGAPTMYIALINHPRIRDYDLTSIKFCISGSAPLPLEVQERFEKLTGGRLIEGYGLSEASPVTHCNNVFEKRKIGSIGLPFPDTDAKIVHMESGEEVKPGEVGELVVRGPQVMKGYWKREEETAAALKDGWLRTGDLAVMDEEGFFYIMDRRKDLIIASGFNIYPREVEEVLFEHPGVLEAVVIGIPDEYRGETVKAFIVARPGAAPTPEELEAWCRGKLAAYKVPRVYEFREELPKTFVGKVLRRQLLEEERNNRKKEP